MINTRIERVMYTWHFPKGKPSLTIEARKGDKIVIRLRNDKAITGIVFEVGTKYLTLKTGVNLQGKVTTYLNWKRIKLSEIKEFAKYPESSQKYKTIKLY